MDETVFGPEGEKTPGETEGAPEPAQVPAPAAQATAEPSSGASGQVAPPNPEPIAQGKVRLKTHWLDDRFDPDPEHLDDLPVITSSGTDVDPSQVEILHERAFLAGIELEEVKADA